MIDEEHLTRGQKRARLHARRGKDLFITGGAGTGKSEVLRLIIKDLENEGKSVVICAPTGVAAVNIGGMTIHSVFGFNTESPINSGGQTGVFSLQKKAPKKIRYADVIIIDEISMVRSDIFDAIYVSIKKAEEKTGKHIQLIVVGDFYQLPPVVKEFDKNGNETLEAKNIKDFYKRPLKAEYAFQGIYWDKCKFYPIILTETVRQDDSTFIENLNKARIGDTSCIGYFNDRLGEPLDNAANLYPRKIDVQEENIRYLSKISGPEYINKTMIKYEDGFDENDIKGAGSGIPADLYFKEGVQVLFTTNDYYGNRTDDVDILLGRMPSVSKDTPYYINGTCGIIRPTVPTIHRQSIEEDRDVLVKTEYGRELLVHPMGTPIYVQKEDPKTKTQKRVLAATAYQLPLKLSHAVTMHSSQGQTYERANIMPESFSPGQLYVSLSRIRSYEGIRLLKPIRERDLIVDPEVSAFYQKIEAGTHKMGRPTIADDGTTRNRLMSIPLPLEKHIRAEIEKGRPLKMYTCPAYKKGRVRIRVQASLAEHIEEEIRSWRETLREKKKDKN